MLDHAGKYAAFFAETRLPSARFCRVWRLVLGDGSIIRMTDHNKDHTDPGSPPETFVSMAGFSPTALRAQIGGVVDNINAEGITSGQLVESKIVRGLFDDAEVFIGVAVWSNPAAGIWWNYRGFAGNIKAEGATFDIQFNTLTDFMTRAKGRAFLGECDVLSFGDTRCGVDIVALGFVQAGTVSATTTFPDGAQNDRTFEIDVVQADGWFQFGSIEFTSGQNIGWSSEVIAHAADIVSLIVKPPYPVAFGATIIATRGCDRTWDTCNLTFDNLVGPAGGGGFKGFGARQGKFLYFMPPDEILAETPDGK